MQILEVRRIWVFAYIARRYNSTAEATSLLSSVVSLATRSTCSWLPGESFLFSYLLACLKSDYHVTCDLYFVTTTDNGDTREETKNDQKKSSGETVGVAFFQTKLNKWDKRFVTMRVSKTKDSFQGSLDSNVHQSIMSRMVLGLSQSLCQIKLYTWDKRVRSHNARVEKKR